MLHFSKKEILPLGGTICSALLVFGLLIYLTTAKITVQQMPKPNHVLAWEREEFIPQPSPFLAGTKAMAQLPTSLPSGTFPFRPQTGVAVKKEFLVLGVLPPKVAIVKDNGVIRAVELGDNISLGEITTIQKDGITVGEQFYDLHKGEKKNDQKNNEQKNNRS